MIDPIVIAIIATATDGLERPPAGHIQRERQFRESTQEYPKGAVLDTPFCRAFHREFYLHDPWLDVTFVAAGDWMVDSTVGRFMHDPIVGSYFDFRMDVLLVRQGEGFAGPRRIYPSPALLRAIQRVVWERE